MVLFRFPRILLCRFETRRLNKFSYSISKRNFSQTSKVNERVQFTSYVKDSIGVIRFDTPNSKVNVLSLEFNHDLMEVLKNLRSSQSLKGVVLMSDKPGCFISGADIKMLQAAKTAEECCALSKKSHESIKQLMNYDIPVVAAVSGHCLGGGFELALACTDIVALETKKTQFGFPEVLLGLLPGAGGTVQAYSKLPYSQALTMLTTGSTLRPLKAKKLGIVGEVVSSIGPGTSSEMVGSQELLESVAVRHALKLATSKRTNVTGNSYLKRAMAYVMTVPMRKLVSMKTKNHFPAPAEAVELLQKYSTLTNINEAFDLEAQTFGKLRETDQCSNLISFFFKRTQAQKMASSGKPREIKKIGVVGCGLMGSGIAEVSLSKGGYKVVCCDLSEKMLSSCYKTISGNFQKLVDRRVFTAFTKESTLNKLAFTTDLQELGEVDIMIEAAAEDLAVKQKILEKFENMASPNAIFATNTSAIALKQLMEASKKPENVVGMHYFSPVPKMELLEIVTHPGISPETLATVIEVGKKQGKLCVVVQDGPGFFTTRALFAALSEIICLFNEGVWPETIDKITTDVGFVYGSASLIDQVGVDVSYHISEYMKKEFPENFGHIDLSRLKSLLDSGNAGYKSGKGLYHYPSYKNLLKKTQMSLEFFNLDFCKVYPYVSTEYKKFFPSAVSINEETIKKRVMGKFLNECALCLQEGIISSPSDGDVASLYGIGFPPATGGPFQYMDNFGISLLVDELKSLSQEYGRKDFEPCQLLCDYAYSGKKFF